MTMRSVLILMLAGAATTVWELDLSGCRFSEPPQVITGIDATPNQMAAMAEVVKAYLQDMNDSLACLDDKEAALGGGISLQDKSLIDVVYNQGVEQMQVIGQGYNDQVEVYKVMRRMPNSGQGVDVIKRGNTAPGRRSSEDDD